MLSKLSGNHDFCICLFPRLEVRESLCIEADERQQVGIIPPPLRLAVQLDDPRERDDLAERAAAPPKVHLLRSLRRFRGLLDPGGVFSECIRNPDKRPSIQQTIIGRLGACVSGGTSKTAFACPCL